MIGYANAKINLGLNILNKREDGYHNIESILYPIKMYDVIEIIESKSSTKIHVKGKEAGAAEDNLCLKAYHLLKNDFDLPPVDIYLLKNIPAGSGLGGGSSDATHTLKVLNALFELNLSDIQLHNYAASLGSDCPFFITNKASLVTGVGTDIHPLESLDLQDYSICVLVPNIAISTAEAYQGIHTYQKEGQVLEIIELGIDNWRNDLFNSFEKGIIDQYPLIGHIKDELYTKGAIYTSMSGSGSAVYGIFENTPDLNDLTTLAEVYCPVEL